MLKNNRGFTLIEMLIVLMIISVLIILIVPNLSGKSKQVHDKGCEALVNVVQAQVDLYHLEEGNLPPTLDSLIQGKYIKASQTECPSKEKLKYEDGIVSAPPTNGQ
ncbi:competence type IV pilus major pilin ComGC [Virgibacillus halodenitrificans]|jgi:competence protein ComGC|uniref:ComG operon protein 3 n=1 Tax=Virgibacillus halodenitrificans TaxID=1482 RepID=A0AAC9NKU5_VIRHA|nr:competence type IV pilus major pilin ComGC [Virgibacillus halodenitrificans]APC48265.1 prepilin-type N-terminal cleavage/methylation domain-containing protein [Virgibacillus halodenitrificans]MCG1029273.1 prepilin-type N-terminal cleavage/methylation domain-containing protein [Virgibacillus halodenitrificans]MCJ0930874.1 prepilin-type N-terminal cleavage/methylation domain-containing protein [Virgibacillus halodenitrificans]MEC2158423.1 competence type IV pilus major pilin ComGC [Virgibacill